MEWLFFLVGITAIGALLLLIGKGVDFTDKEFRKNGVQTQGLVVKNIFHLGRLSHFRPVVRFESQDGKVIEAEDTHGVAYAIPRFSKGATINLIYIKSNPEDFRITSRGIMD